MLTPYLPYPPSSGGKIRSYNLIKNLARKHQITLFSLIKREDEKKYVSELEKYCHKVRVFKVTENPWQLGNILKTLFSFYPFLVIRNFSSQEKEAVAQELALGKYDLIHAETFYVMPHLPKVEIPILLVEQTIEFQVYLHFAQQTRWFFLKPFFYFDVAKLRWWEVLFWKTATKTVAVSEADKAKMLSLVPKLSVEVVANGAGEDLMSLWGKRKVDFGRPIIFYQGNFPWLQNVEGAEFLARKVFPLIRDKIPESVCWIVGQRAKEKVGYLKAKQIKVFDLANDNIQGVIDAYRRATVFLAPLFGPGGTRLKILGAMAAGVPVVTTKIGIEGIRATNGEEVLVADSPTELAQATVEIIKNKNLYQKITLAARRLVEKEYCWPVIAQKLDKIYRQLGYEKN